MSGPFALVIEDEHDISIIFAKALEAAGFETAIADAGDVALKWLSSTAPDVVVLDLNLPQMPGTEILHHIRADARLTNTKVIIATAYPHIAQTIYDEADCVLSKPVSFSQLRDLAARFGLSASSGKQNEQTANV